MSRHLGSLRANFSVFVRSNFETRHGGSTFTCSLKCVITIITLSRVGWSRYHTIITFLRPVEDDRVTILYGADKNTCCRRSNTPSKYMQLILGNTQLMENIYFLLRKIYYFLQKYTTCCANKNFCVKSGTYYMKNRQSMTAGSLLRGSHLECRT